MGDSRRYDQLLSVELQTEAGKTRNDALFDQLTESECPYVWSSLRRLGVPHAECEDLMQEVFVRVHRTLASFDSSRSVRPWLFGFAMRVASEHRRLARHQREVKSDAEVADTRPLADEQMAIAQRRRVVATALDVLDEDRRAVFILHDLDETPIPEVAKALGVADGTAYSRLKAARDQFAAAVRRLVVRGGAP